MQQKRRQELAVPTSVKVFDLKSDYKPKQTKL